MKKHTVLVAALCAVSPALVAQEDRKQQPADTAHQDMPNPKTAEHDALRSLVGTWETTCKTEAVPGQAGMEQPGESKGTEHTELICNGLWAKSAVTADFMGQKYEGLWLAGYDPHEKAYIGLYLDNHESVVPCEMQGSYDKATKTWTWTGKSPKGDDVRSVFVQKDADTSVETCYMTPAGGDKEVKVMEITRKRSSKSGAPVSASATHDGAAAAAASLTEGHKALQKDVGEWDATVKTPAAGGEPASESKATERVQPICGGKFLWSDFRGSMMGQPFEGHAIVGYDPTSKEVVSFWIDSMMPGYAVTKGKFADGQEQLTLTGTCPDPMGNAMKMTETITWKGNDEKVMQIEFTSDQGTHKMEITSTRKGGANRGMPGAAPAGKSKSGY